MKYKIENISLFGYHGINDEEKDNGQFFYIDIIYSINNDNQIYKDKIDDFIDYVDIFNDIKLIFNSKRYNLIETIAFDIHSELSLKYNIINKLEVSVTKKDPLKDKQINNVSFKYKK